MKELQWREDKSCIWTLVDEDANAWETGCDNMFQFDVEGPAENKFKYCPYCGSELEEVDPTAEG